MILAALHSTFVWSEDVFEICFANAVVPDHCSGDQKCFAIIDQVLPEKSNSRLLEYYSKEVVSIGFFLVFFMPFCTRENISSLCLLHTHEDIPPSYLISTHPLHTGMMKIYKMECKERFTV